MRLMSNETKDKLSYVLSILMVIFGTVGWTLLSIIIIGIIINQIKFDLMVVADAILFSWCIASGLHGINKRIK